MKQCEKVAVHTGQSLFFKKLALKIEIFSLSLLYYVCNLKFTHYDGERKEVSRFDCQRRQAHCLGTRSLIYRLAGSPLSGVNRCVAVCEDGTEEKVQLRSFSNYWLPFMKINQRYSPAKACYQAYSLQEVLDILKTPRN